MQEGGTCDKPRKRKQRRRDYVLRSSFFVDRLLCVLSIDQRTLPRTAAYKAYKHLGTSKRPHDREGLDVAY